MNSEEEVEASENKIIVRQSNTPHTHSCENCNRKTKNHYLIEKEQLTPEVACEYCLQEVITQQTTSYFTTQSLKSHVYRKKNEEYKTNMIEPLDDDDIVKLVEGTFIHDGSSVFPEDDVFDRLSVDTDINLLQDCKSVKTFSGYMDCVGRNRAELKSDTTKDGELMISPSYERQAELMLTFDLYNKWVNQDTTIVCLTFINSIIKRIVEHTETDEKALRNSNDF